jgi:hypothetical protein
MKNLFQPKSLAAKLDEYCLDDNWFKTAQEIFNRWNTQVELSKEKENQQQFLQEFFGVILGYQAIAGKKDNSLWWESGSKVDGTKPDGILGFNLLSYKTGEIDNQKIGDIRAVIELKDANTNLDAKQNRKNSNYSPVEQAFSYASKVGGNCEFVIVSNFIETRLYLAGDQSRAHVFFLKDLAENKEKQKEFHFLLAKNRLFSLTQKLSPTHNLNKTPSGKEIEEEFYAHYKNLRQDIWQDLIKLNTNPKFSKNFYLYKAQKLIDRIIFIRFCRENGALDNDAVLEALNHELVAGKYNRLKLLFSAMDLGNANFGIAKFNGGLFAPDLEMDELQVSDPIIDKIKTLYDYNFGSDLDINILGHIFEQSISDLENLTNSNEKKRKKDGIFYTPAFVTKYIVESAVGGWLDDQKAQIKSKIKDGENSAEFWQEYAKKLAAIKVLDPACGSGAFLVEVFDFLQKQWQQVASHIKTNFTYLDILTKNIFGVDLNPTSVGITKLSLWLKTAHHRQPLCALDGNIKIGNSLIDDENVAGYYHEFEGRFVQETIDAQGGLFAQEDFSQSKKDIEENFKKSLAFKWHQEFPQVFTPIKNDSKQSGFDVVVGNPPYVSAVTQKLSKELRDYYIKIYRHVSGAFDLYMLFLLQGVFLLNKNGKFGWVIPNKLLSSEYSKKGLEYLASNCQCSSYDVSFLKIFENVGVYPIIFLGSNGKNGLKKYSIKSFEPFYSEEEKTFFKNYKTFTEFGIKVECGAAGFEAQKIAQNIHEKNQENLIPFAVSGSVDRFNLDLENVQYMKKNYQRAFVDQKCVSQNRQKLWGEPKIIVAGMTKKVEAIYYKEPLGLGVGIYAINDCKEFHPLCLLAILNSKFITFWMKESFKDKHLAGGYLAINAGNIECFPLVEIYNQKPLVEKAQKMLELNQDFHQKVSEFLDFFCQKFSIKKTTRNLQNWHQLSFGELTQEILKQKIKLESDIEFGFKKLFEKQKLICQNLQNQIDQTDNEIDALVYQIYQLDAAEIELIENLNSNCV